MPVVSEPSTGLTHKYAYGFFSNISTPYLILSILFFLCITIFIRRKRSTATKLQYNLSSSRPATPLLEKSDITIFSYRDSNTNPENRNPPLQNPNHQSTSSIDFTTSPAITTSPQQFSRPPPPPPFTSPSPLEPLPYSPITSSPTENALPRRRSYTKPPNPLTNTPIVNGEIISGEGWRRHTRVFGGGVCEACAESERRMSA